MDEHESIRKLLPLAAADALEFEEIRRVELHARDCESCRRELDTWRRYSEALHQLPQPSMPPGLLERTYGRVLDQNSGAASERKHAFFLGSVALLGWALSFALWIVARSLAGHSLNVLGINLLSPLAWLLLSALLTWITAATSAYGVRSALRDED